jgi:DNA primase
MSATLEDLIQRIKDVPVSEILGRYIHTSRKGSQTTAVCPFHDDHDPSLSINDTRGMWYCFVDRLGGDAIRFVMLYRNLEFKNALEDICGKLGWDYSSYIQAKKISPKVELGKKVLAISAKLYRKIAETKESDAFKDFLSKRKLDEELAKDYQLGFAPDGSALFDYFSSITKTEDKAKALSMAQELGLIKPSKFGDKTHYDTFRSRIIFPIWDQFGQVIGYTSRATQPDQKPKYMNSIDSFLFNKSNLLYGLHLAKPYVRERSSVILVEGNMDQIALYKFGFKNTVACMGVAVGESSLTRLLSLTKNILLSLDNDQAGWKASCRINGQLLHHGVIPKFIDLSPHKDPDDFLEEEGPVAMQKRVDDAQYFIDVEIERLIPKEIPEVSERKLELLHKVFSILSPLKSSLSATERVSQVAKRIGLQSDSSTIIKSYEDYLINDGAAPQPPQAAVPVEEAIDLSEAIPPHEHGFREEPTKLTRNISMVEARLLQNLVQNPTLLTSEEVSELLDFVENPEVKEYILKLKDIVYEVDDSEYLSVLDNLMNGAEYSAELSSVISAALYKHHEIHFDLKDEKVIKKTIDDIKRRLQEEGLKEKKAALKLKQKNVNTPEEYQDVLQQLHKVEKEMQQFRAGASRRKKTNHGHT